MHQFMRITRERERKLRDYSFPVEFSFLTTRDSFLSRTYISLSLVFSPIRWFSRGLLQRRRKGRKEGKITGPNGSKVD